MMRKIRTSPETLDAIREQVRATVGLYPREGEPLPAGVDAVLWGVEIHTRAGLAYGAYEEWTGGAWQPAGNFLRTVTELDLGDTSNSYRVRLGLLRPQP